MHHQQHTRAAVLRLVAIGVMLGATGSTQANIITYTTPASYAAATTGNTTVNFSGIAPAMGFVSVNVPPGITVGGINFTINQATSNGSLFVVDGAFSNNPWGVPLLDSQFSTQTDENILITLPHAVTAAAFDFGSLVSSPVTFTLSTGETFGATTAGKPNLQFLGVTSSVPFTSIEISQPIGNAVVLEDVTIGTALAVPEPSTLALFAIGGLGLLGWRRWRGDARRRSSPSDAE
jgi:PEP-CTERM motif